jgi:hypothetical protein
VPAEQPAGSPSGRQSDLQTEVLVRGGPAELLRRQAIPSVAYTDPEVARVGMTETEAKAAGISYGKGVFPVGGQRPDRCPWAGTKGSRNCCSTTPPDS